MIESLPSTQKNNGQTPTIANVFILTQISITEFIDTLEISDSLKAELKTITPSNYTGI